MVEKKNMNVDHVKNKKAQPMRAATATAGATLHESAQ